MITLTFTSENLKGIKAEMNEFLNFGQDAAQLELVVPEVPKKKSKKKSKSKVAEPVSVDSPTALDTAPDAGEVPSAKKEELKKQCTEALQKLNTDKGIEAAKAILESFSCKRLGELKADDYVDFIQACAGA